MTELTDLSTLLLSRAKIIDLGHKLEENMPFFPAHGRFYKMLWNSPSKGDRATNYQFIMNEHNGTHVDAPVHFIPGQRTIDELPLDMFMGPCCVIDVSFLGEGGILEPSHITDWEAKHGPISAGDVVLFNYGWAAKWKLMPDHQAYSTKYPGVGGDAARLLCDRKVKLVGCDTLAVESTATTGNPAHNTLLGSDVLVAENLNNLPLLPPRCFFLCLPLAIAGGSGSPVRPVALTF